MKRRPSFLRRLGLLAAALLPGLFALSLATAGPAAAQYPVGTIGQGFATEIFNPGGMPAGMNLWNCKPTAAHPYPVILVHGTLANENFSWQALSPELANAGYCVYGFNYGADGSTLGRFYGLTDIAQSAGQLSSFVNQVLAATGASQVDLVGHSQGGMMPRYYIKFLGGAAKVNMLVGLAPSNHGTTAGGLNALVAAFDAGGVPILSLAGCVSCTEQVNGSGSNFLSNLNAGGDTQPGPKYVVIESKYDEVVTPYTSAFLSGPSVQNILLQNQCSLDFTEHLGIIYDPVALQDVMNALGADSPTFKPNCSVVFPVFSG
jgi:triacylglycerol esterase/lipase EstA (alpha/beta hydrolase family)